MSHPTKYAEQPPDFSLSILSSHVVYRAVYEWHNPETISRVKYFVCEYITPKSFFLRGWYFFLFQKIKKKYKAWKKNQGSLNSLSWYYYRATLISDVQSRFNWPLVPCALCHFIVYILRASYLCIYSF